MTDLESPIPLSGIRPPQDQRWAGRRRGKRGDTTIRLAYFGLPLCLSRSHEGVEPRKAWLPHLKATSIFPTPDHEYEYVGGTYMMYVGRSYRWDGIHHWGELMLS